MWGHGNMFDIPAQHRVHLVCWFYLQEIMQEHLTSRYCHYNPAQWLQKASCVASVHITVRTAQACARASLGLATPLV